MNRTVIAIAGSFVVASALAFIIYHSKKQGFRASRELAYKNGFLPSRQGLYFQGMPPSLEVENAYHSLMEQECQGDYSNIECRQKSYIKAMKNGTTDKADLICSKYSNDEDRYYACLDSVYGNYMWMDRYVGTDSCACFRDPGKTGIVLEDGSCLCPSERPLNDRRPTDSSGSIVNRVMYHS